MVSALVEPMDGMLTDMVIGVLAMRSRLGIERRDTPPVVPPPRLRFTHQGVVVRVRGLFRPRGLRASLVRRGVAEVGDVVHSVSDIDPGESLNMLL